jgi:hypothetical protein
MIAKIRAANVRNRGIASTASGQIVSDMALRWTQGSSIRGPYRGIAVLDCPTVRLLYATQMYVRPMRLCLG